MLWSTADVPLCAELAMVLEVCSCQCHLKHPGPQEEAWSHICPPTLSWTKAHAQV